MNASGERVAFAPGEPNLVIEGDRLHDPRWSPTLAPDEKEWIVFWEEASEGWNIWLADPDTPSQKIPLTQDTEIDNYHPTWSPDATRIAFLSAPAVVSCSCPGDVEILHLGVDSNGILELQDRVSLILENPHLDPPPAGRLSESWVYAWGAGARILLQPLMRLAMKRFSRGMNGSHHARESVFSRQPRAWSTSCSRPAVTPGFLHRS